MYFEEFFVGQHFKLNPIILTSQEIYEFAHRYDPQPIHIDPEFAKNGIFKGIIASGFHTLSMVWSEWIRTNRFGTEIIGGTGLDFVQWTAPVRPGDTLYADVEVTETLPSSKGNRGLVALKFTVTNQKDETVLVTQGRVYLKRKGD
ncbi:MaoC/PaaZ C-terminal domain-containing protein [Kyrpidia sp.]|uniref:MaoC/PaaZ C-terminal domain-containing protein n=1 Tax=Kyrpidia sp. TaxID=2073077 RepID=UPI001857F356|nr:MaoC/PaaZ C-terminal domain-containing protein [Kyrpidia sp.]MCL6577094.1 MaoC family dehydratase N-terminal domain-containing protein [Kyrpidia sp.]HHY67782.1 acyl dehydratase [Alicyclobacillus sp.]